MAKGKGGFIGHDGLNAPDAPTGVSGTAGNEQVEVSWTAPSDVGGSAITGYNVQSNDGSGSYATFPLSTYTDNSFLLTGQTNNPYGVLISNDGLVMLVLDRQNSNVLQYNLSTAYDVSTASYDSALNLSSQTTQPQGFSAAKNGEKIYVTEEGTDPDYVFEYTLTTGWDVSTGSYSSNSYSISGTVASSSGIYVKNDGTKMYVRSTSSDLIYQFSLSTAYDVSTASYDSKTLDVSGESTNGYSLTFLNSGYYVYVSDANDNIYEYELTTAWDISTGSYTGNSFDVSSQETSTLGVDFSDDGSKFYVTGQSSDTVYEYTVPDYPTASPVTITGLTNGTSYTFNVWAINAFGWSAPSNASGSVTASGSAFWVGGAIANDNWQNVIQQVSFSSLGNSNDWGDLTEARGKTSGCSSATRGLCGGGRNGSGDRNTIDYYSLSSSGNASDFGDLINTVQSPTALANSTRGVWGGGETGTPQNVIQYVTIASTGNAADFGDLTVTRQKAGSASSSTRGLFNGGSDSGNSATNVIDYITIASTGNASDFGDLAVNMTFASGASNSTRALFTGNSNTINYVTIATTGNASDFGDLLGSQTPAVGAASDTRALFLSGLTIQYVEINTTGNATDFGDAQFTQQGNETFGSGSTSHGGLS